ncbi:MAG: Rho termination factor N-terminal domain-containing protein, partial [Treponemataceae bacterium]|nr:Rho termination factor N-terminal domain-containing protein [Treponemataceae bacterium]
MQLESNEEQVNTSAETEKDSQIQMDFEQDATSDASESKTESETTENTENKGDNAEGEQKTGHRERVAVRSSRGQRRRPNGNPRRDNNGGRDNNGRSERNYSAEAAASQELTPEEAAERETKPRLSINELSKMGMHELRNLAEKYGLNRDDLAPMKKQELVYVILRAHTEHGGIIFASGALEILPDGYGFLRSPHNSYLPGPEDI